MKQINLTTKITVYSYDECTELEKKLIDAAKEASIKDLFFLKRHSLL